MTITFGTTFVTVSGLLSGLGGTLVLTTFALFPVVRILNFGYLFMMTISDTLFGLTFAIFEIVPTPQSDTWQCKLNGFVNIWIYYICISRHNELHMVFVTRVDDVIFWIGKYPIFLSNFF